MGVCVCICLPLGLSIPISPQLRNPSSAKTMHEALIVNMTPLLNSFPTQRPFPHRGVLLESLMGQTSCINRSFTKWWWEMWMQLGTVLKMRPNYSTSERHRKGPLSLLSSHSSACSTNSRQKSLRKTMKGWNRNKTTDYLRYQRHYIQGFE